MHICWKSQKCNINKFKVSWKDNFNKGDFKLKNGLKRKKWWNK